MYPKGFENHIKTHIGNGASIGANATIVCGHNIGNYAMIGAGAVVTTNVKDYALMLGVPARFVGWACECGELLDETFICRSCGRGYDLKDGDLKCNSAI
jgi:UDP-2-acetamido-3-amino-2,3-dideoxy-glucuronate N-acetyltransferase